MQSVVFVVEFDFAKHQFELRIILGERLEERTK